MSRRYSLSVGTNNTYLTITNGSIMFTEISTEFVVENAEELAKKVQEFLTQVEPHPSMPSGMDQEQINEHIEDQRNKREVIEKFIQDINGTKHKVWADGEGIENYDYDHFGIELDMVDVF